MHGSKSWRLLAGLLLSLCFALACNLFESPATPAPSTGTTPASSGDPGILPTIHVLWPPSGSEFVVGEEIAVRVSASDGVGITRIVLRSSINVLSTRPSAERNQTTFEAILPWTPARSGEYDLEVIAYRGSVSSSPEPLRLVIRDTAGEVVNAPPPFGQEGPAAAAQPGAVCQVRVDIDSLRYRSGPGTQYEILGLLDLGETLSVVGRNADGSWWQINRDGQIAWTSANRSYNTPLTDCSTAPIVQ